MKPNYRRCLSCRKVALKQAFWRIVRVSSSSKSSLEPVTQEWSAPSIALDKGMGRSAYLCPQATCLQLAQKKDRLGRVLKATVPDHLYKTLWQRLANDPDSPLSRDQHSKRVGTLAQPNDRNSNDRQA